MLGKDILHFMCYYACCCDLFKNNSDVTDLFIDLMQLEYAFRVRAHYVLAHKGFSATLDFM